MYKFLRSFIITIITIAILLTSSNVEVIAHNKEYKGKLNKLSAPTVVMNEEEIPEEIELKEPEIYEDFDEVEGEVVSFDDESITYQTGEREFTTVVGGTPSVYEDDNGNLQEIDNTLVEKGDAFENALNAFSIQLPKEISEGRGIVIEKDGYYVELFPIEGDFSNTVVKENAILYNEVFPGIDYQYTILGNSLKEDIILRKEVEQLSFRYELKTNLDVLYNEENRIIELKDGDSDIFVLDAPVMSDANGNASLNIDLRVEEDDERKIVIIEPDKKWISAEERVYPIKIDPNTVTIRGTSLFACSVQEDLPHYPGGSNSIFAGYDDGYTSGTINYGSIHGKTRAYLALQDNLSGIPKEAKINSATLTMYQKINLSNKTTKFGIYRVHNKWDTASIGWLTQENFEHTYISTGTYSNSELSISFDVKEAINSWVQGLYENNGLVIKALNENEQCETFYGSYSELAPKLVIEWEIPDPVDTNYSLDKTTINVRPITEKDVKGKLRFDGVFADGVAKPKSLVLYTLKPSNISGISEANVSYKYPDSTEFNKTFPNGTKYKDKDSNYQTEMFGSGDLEYDKIYYFTATASKDNKVGKETKSDTFLIYKAKGNETLPNIAKYYGAPLQTIMKDNQVQDVLVIQNNTIFIRNPKKTKPYVSNLSIDDKKLIDAALMGRGLHCEYGFEPINLNTGNFYFNTSDLEIEDLGGVFGIERTYNSKADYNNSVFGHHWSFKYDEHLSKLENGNILYSTGEGKILQFVYKDGKYISPEGYYLSLKEVKYIKNKIEYTKYEIIEQSGFKRIFNTYGLLEEIVDELGHSTKLEYDKNYNINKLISPTGKTITLKTNEFGQIIEAILPNGSKLEYKYDDNDDLVEYIDANGNSIRYEYENHLMTAWYDQEGNRVVLNEYDDEGRVTKQTDANDGVVSLIYGDDTTTTIDANGNKTVYTYDELKRTKRIEYPNGKIENYSYDENNNLISDYDYSYTYDKKGNILTQTNKSGGVATYTYNGDNQVTSFTDYANNKTTFTYKNKDLIKITYPNNTSESFSYDNEHRLISHTDRNGNTEKYSYSGATPISYTDFNGNTYSFNYNNHNKITTIKDPLGHVTRYMYNNSGWQIGEQLADGAFLEYTFDKVGNVVKIKDGNGAVSSFTYDALGNILSATNPQGDTVTFSYDKNNNKTSEIDALGNKTTFGYDSMNHQVEETNSKSQTITYEYDVKGNVGKVTYPNGSTIINTYDVLNNKISDKDELGNETKYEYDALGQLLKVNNPDNTTIEYEYDSLGNITSFIEETGLVNKFEYDNNGNSIKLTKGDRVYQYVYDKNNNLIKTKDALGYEAGFEYDSLNRLISETNENGGTTKYEYDAVGRVKTVIDHLENKKSVSYDFNGNIKSVKTSNGGEYIYNYNAINNLISEKNPLGHITNYDYDQNEQLTSITDALNNKTKYEYDSLGNVSKVIDALGNYATFEYDELNNLSKVIYKNGDGVSYTYDEKGNVLSTVDAAGLKTSYKYDSMDRIIEEKDNAGNKLTYTYDEFGRLITITDILDRKEEYTYNEYSEVVSIKNMDGDITTLSYDNLGRVSSYSENGIETKLEYDAIGNIVKETENDEKVYEYVYDKLSRVTSVTNPIKATTSYEYDSESNITSVVDGNGVSTKYEYDLLNNLISFIDGNNNKTSFKYDELNRLLETIYPEGNSESYRYDAVGNVVQYKDGNDYVTNYKYDLFGNLLEEISPRNATTKYTYDKHNNVTSITDALGNKTKYEVDLNGLTNKITLPNGGTYSYSYDKIHRITDISTPNGYQKTFTYDDKGNVTKESDNMNRKTSYEYDDKHNVVGIIDPKGNKTTYKYDAYHNLLETIQSNRAKTSYSYDLLNQLTTQTDAENKVTKLEYDGAGNILSIIEAGNRKTSLTYDNNYNVISVKEPMGYTSKLSYDKNNRLTGYKDAKNNTTKYSYDNNSNVLSISNAKNIVEKYEYDSHNNVISTTNKKGKKTNYKYDLNNNLISVSNTIFGEVTYEYDKMGNLITTNTGNGKTTYKYDLENNLTEIKSFSGKVEKQEYDLLGNVKKIVRPDSTTVSYDYDALNNLVNKTYSEDDSEVVYLYDTEGNRTKMSDTIGDTKYEYDIMNRIVSMTDTEGREVKYDYDECGRLSSITYPEGKKVSYKYDLNDRLVEVNDDGFITKYTYNEVNQLISTIRPDNSKTAYEYDELGNITKLSNNNSTGALVSSFEYEYDENNNIIKEVSKNDNEEYIREFTYDDIDQLISFTETNDDKTVKQKYEYDALGNRTKLISDDETITYRYNSDNQLISKNSSIEGDTTYTYDVSSDLITETNSDSNITYEYTVSKRLQAIKENGQLLMAVSYDGDDNRIFQVSKRDREEKITYQSVISYEEEKADKDNSKEKGSKKTSDTIAEDNKGVITYYETQYTDSNISIFWYGFTQSFLQFSSGANTALSYNVSKWFHNEWDNLTRKYEMILHYKEYDKTDVESMKNAGLSDEEIQRIMSGLATEDKKEKDNKKTKDQKDQEKYNNEVVIPAQEITVNRVDYELTYYVNDVNRDNVQVLEEYGKKNELINSYSYGNQRISIDTNNEHLYNQIGTSYYLYDGRGSVSNILNNNTSIQSYTYDPYGNVTSKLNDIYTSYYGYNAEDSNPITGLQYLRYRYYDTNDGRFNTRDSYLGSINNPLTLNRYAYTTNNPINYIDPSGHIGIRNYSVMMSDGGGGIPKPIKPKPISTIGKSIINTYKSQSYSSKTILSNVNNKVKAIQSKSIGASATSVLQDSASLKGDKYLYKATSKALLLSSPKTCFKIPQRINGIKPEIKKIDTRIKSILDENIAIPVDFDNIIYFILMMGIYSVTNSVNILKNNIKSVENNDKTFNEYTVYGLVYLENGSEIIKYVGRTKNLNNRIYQHDNSFRHGFDRVEVLKDNLSYFEARGYEDYYMFYYHTLNKAERIANQIRGISLKNTNLKLYLLEAIKHSIFISLEEELSNRIEEYIRGLTD